ncbi:MAG: hypothetical protein MHPSP_002105, partial [Paramarteilia canceri]
MGKNVGFAGTALSELSNFKNETFSILVKRRSTSILTLALIGSLTVAILNQNGIDYQDLECVSPNNYLNSHLVSEVCKYYEKLYFLPDSSLTKELIGKKEDGINENDFFTLNDTSNYINWYPYVSLVFVGITVFLTICIRLIEEVEIYCFDLEYSKVEGLINYYINLRDGKDLDKMVETFNQKIDDYSRYMEIFAEGAQINADLITIEQSQIINLKKFERRKLKDEIGRKAWIMHLLLYIYQLIIICIVYSMIIYIFSKETDWALRISSWDFISELFEYHFNSKSYPIYQFCQLTTNELWAESQTSTSILVQCSNSRNFLNFVIINSYK